LLHPTEFVTGERYSNRKGTYTVLAVEPPHIHVRYDDGLEESLDIAVQQRILSNMTLPPRTPEPPPRRRSGAAAPRASAPRSAPPAGATAPPALSVPRAAPAARGRRAAASPASRHTLAQIAAMSGKDQQRARQDALLATLASPDAFREMVDRSREAERGRLNVFPVSQVTRLNEAAPPPTAGTPQEFLSYTIATNRAYLAVEGQEIRASHFPLYEAGVERYVIDLLCYDERARRAMLVCVNAKTTVRRWLWEALLDSLRNWAAVSATPGFPAALDGDVVEAPPAIVILGPRGFWAENAPGAGAHVEEVAAGHALNARLLAAVEDWMRIPTLLLQVPDDWLRTADQLDYPRISVAPFPRSAG
jgi:hypothetical protein